MLSVVYCSCINAVCFFSFQSISIFLIFHATFIIFIKYCFPIPLIIVSTPPLCHLVLSCFLSLLLLVLLQYPFLFHYVVYTSFLHLLLSSFPICLPIRINQYILFRTRGCFKFFQYKFPIYISWWISYSSRFAYLKTLIFQISKFPLLVLILFLLSKWYC